MLSANTIFSSTTHPISANHLPHSIVASPCGAPYNDGELRNVRTCNSRHQLRAVLSNSTPLRVCTYHEARDILQENERYPSLGAKLDEMGTFERRFRKQDSVIRDDADRLATNRGKACDESCAIRRLELGELRPVHQPCDNFVYWNLTTKRDADDARQLFGIMQRLFPSLVGHNSPIPPRETTTERSRPSSRWPIQILHASPRQYDGMRVVHRAVVCHPAHLSVCRRAAERLSADLLPRRGLDQRRTRKEDVALLLHDDALVAHAGHVRAARRARAHDGGELWDALGRHAGLVVEDAAEVVAVWEDVGLVGEVGAAGVDEVDAGEAWSKGKWLVAKRTSKFLGGRGGISYDSLGQSFERGHASSQ